jgi:hypothetical protein
MENLIFIDTDSSKISNSERCIQIPEFHTYTQHDEVLSSLNNEINSLIQHSPFQIKSEDLEIISGRLFNKKKFSS